MAGFGTVLVLLVFMLFAIATSSVRAQSLVGIFDLGMGARPLAMGGAFTAVADDDNALLYNPAGLAALDELHFHALFESRFSRVSDGSVALAGPHLGGSLFLLNVGNIPNTDETGRQLGTFAYGNFGLIAGAGYRLSDLFGSELPLTLGAQLKFLSVSTLPAGSGISVALAPALLLDLSQIDLGFLRMHGLRAGLMLQNLLGLPLCYGSGHCEPWALGARLGLAADISTDLTLALDLETSGNIHLGGEWHMQRADLLREGLEELALRAGIMTTGNVFSFTAGFGLAYQNFTLDYAFISHPELGGSHRFSFGAHFDIATLLCILRGQTCPGLKD
jgi:hypothetical protein